ncbi:peptide chain release factor N(5)-glutamine methyltransferase [Candidatus Dojkabacteria bacterium]|uniref:Peptide chain release factor N(5)-glutamine methyltransferase n=1 Tax=Candidatus Dojkabacteria bacterium TaxID=2099670 RepID=A0A955L8Y9_9BACT|nr:peptide chain release factor N(5)-glutamine methyltransferase [Candidatus Dojkabacteria bacterium]
MTTVDKLEESLYLKLREVSESPDLEVKLLLCYVLNCTKEELVLLSSKEIPTAVENKALELVKKRLLGYPIDYIIGYRYFYNDKFYVSPDTLIPRPETELLVDLALTEINSYPPSKKNISILEIGTGTGCISISIASQLVSKHYSENREITFIATDISENALHIAKKNLNHLINDQSNTPFNFIHADIYTPFNKEENGLLSKQRYDLIVSNPPYIPSSRLKDLPSLVQHEPEIALDGGKDGNSLIKRIVEEVWPYTKNNSAFILEIYEESENSLRELLNEYSKNYNFHYKFLPDLTGRIRFLTLHRTK